MSPHPRDHSGYGKKTCQFSPTLGTREGTQFGYRTLHSRRRLPESMARLAANDGRARGAITDAVTGRADPGRAGQRLSVGMPALLHASCNLLGTGSPTLAQVHPRESPQRIWASRRGQVTATKALGKDNRATGAMSTRAGMDATSLR